MAATIVMVTLVVFICPQSVMAASHQLSAGMTALCHNDSISAPMANGSGATSGCFDRHLAVAEQFTKTLFDNTKLWSVLSLVVLIIVGAVQALSSRPAGLKSLAYLRYRYRRYLTHIRPWSQKKILAWLALSENYDRALTV